MWPTGARGQLPLSCVFSLVVGTGIWRQTAKQVSLAVPPCLRFDHIQGQSGLALELSGS